MQRADTIPTTQVGSLPRPQELLRSYLDEGSDRRSAEPGDPQVLADAVADVVRRQAEIGLDVVGDGEFGHPVTGPYDFSSWRTYVFERLGGLELVDEDAVPHVSPSREKLSLGAWEQRRDLVRFGEAYSDPASGVATPYVGVKPPAPVCTAPLTYRGEATIQRDIANLKAALEAAGLRDGFLNAVGPASCARFANLYYEGDERMLEACADAMHHEYRAIVEAGLVLQIDDPAIADNWDLISPEPRVDDYLQFTRVRIDALNRALRGLPPERIRFHLCWGSWHGPHVTDIPMADIVRLMLEVHAGAFSFEAANVRHEHEWRIWNEVELPAGKVLVPGVVSHATNVVEHPVLVADRICRFADAVGRERVIASTDCGLGGRVHKQIAWAKLEALVEGAALAGRRLWP